MGGDNACDGDKIEMNVLVMTIATVATAENGFDAYCGGSSEGCCDAGCGDCGAVDCGGDYGDGFCSGGRGDTD